MTKETEGSLLYVLMEYKMGEINSGQAVKEVGQIFAQPSTPSESPARIFEFKNGQKVTTDDNMLYWLLFYTGDVGDFVKYEFDMSGDRFTILRDFKITVKLEL